MGSDIAIGKPVCKLMAAWYGAHVHGSCDNCHRQDIRTAKTMMIFISFNNHCTGGLRCGNTNTINNNDDDDDDDDVDSDDDDDDCEINRIIRRFFPQYVGPSDRGGRAGSLVLEKGTGSPGCCVGQGPSEYILQVTIRGARSPTDSEARGLSKGCGF